MAERFMHFAVYEDYDGSIPFGPAKNMPTRNRRWYQHRTFSVGLKNRRVWSITKSVHQINL